MPCGYCALRGLLQPMLETAQENFAALGENDIYRNTKATADSGFHTERNAEYLYTHHIDGYVADNRMRQRDPRFHDVDKYKARAREERRQRLGIRETFSNKDFRYDPDQHTCICPAGKPLYSNGSFFSFFGFVVVFFFVLFFACCLCLL